MKFSRRNTYTPAFIPQPRTCSRSTLTLAIAGLTAIFLLSGEGKKQQGTLNDPAKAPLSGTKTPFVSTPPNLSSQLQAFLPSSNLKGTSCADVRLRVQRGDWIDPNHGYIHARTLTSYPPFPIAVHQSSYDKMRWNSLYIKGAYYETAVHERFLRILEKSTTTNKNEESSEQQRSLVVDVGMNIGYYTLLSATLGHSVIGFEINPANLMRVCESISLNMDQWHATTTTTSSSNDENDNGDKNHNLGKSPVTFFQRGVSNLDDQTLHLVVPKNPGEATLEQTPSTAAADVAASVTTITLDTFAKEQGWLDGSNKSKPTIRLLKIDVEGHEPEIIQGARHLLKSGMVQNILTEYRDFGSDRTRQAFEVLLDAGYTLVHQGKLLSKSESQAFYRDLMRKRLHHESLRKTLKAYFKKHQFYLDLWFSCPECGSDVAIANSM